MRREQLDEMQVHIRNKIGNQAFIVLFYLLLIDIGLYGFGFRWLNYPLDVFVIMLGVMTYYLVRIIWNGAYVGPAVKDKNVTKKTVGVTVAAAFLAAVTVFITQRNQLAAPSANDGGGGAIILFLSSLVAIIIAVVVSVIAKRQNDKMDE